MPPSLSVASACSEAACLCFWHCVNNPPPRALLVFLALSLLLFRSLALCIFPPLFLDASGSHSTFCVCVHLIWGRNCLHFSFSYFICTIIDCFCPHANVWRIASVCFESFERTYIHTHTHAHTHARTHTHTHTHTHTQHTKPLPSTHKWLSRSDVPSYLLTC